MLPFMRSVKGRSIKYGANATGFTLIELVAVIVILSIVATIGTGFVVKTTESYQRTQTRALLVNTARQSLERMTRQLRMALPHSIVFTNNNSCIKFMPIAGGGNYFSPVPDDDNLAPPADKISASPVVIDFGSPTYVAIGAMAANEVYGTNAASRASYSSYTDGNINLSSAKHWRRNSINKRYYLLDRPQAFCVVANELRFYEGLDVNATDVNVLGTSSILARNITTATPFSIMTAGEGRNAAINIALGFSSAGETINYPQRVLIRNVP